MHLSVGLPLQDLAERFGIDRTTTSRITATWTRFLYNLLGSQHLWISHEAVRAHLPPEFSAFPYTQVVLDCTEVFCQTPSSLCCRVKFFPRIDLMPHSRPWLAWHPMGPLHSFLACELSRITNLLTPNMAIMVNKGFLVDNLAPCKVYQPAFLWRYTQMSREDVRQTQSIAHLRVHVEKCIRRVK